MGSKSHFAMTDLTKRKCRFCQGHLKMVMRTGWKTGMARKWYKIRIWQCRSCGKPDTVKTKVQVEPVDPVTPPFVDMVRRDEG